MAEALFWAFDAVWVGNPLTLSRGPGGTALLAVRLEPARKTKIIHT
jgi:hypothetical protein